MAALRAYLPPIPIALLLLALVAWWSMSTASGSVLPLSGSAPTLEALKLVPGVTVVSAGTTQSYRAIGLDEFGNETDDVTAQTDFTITAPGKCSQAAGKVSCTASEVGDYTVTGTLDQPNRDQLRATATLRVIDPVVSLRLNPPKAEIPAGAKQPYTAVAEDQFGNETDVTAQTDFTIDQPGTCTKAGAEVSCTATKAQAYTVTGTLRDPRLSATATLIVVDETPTIPPTTPGCCCCPPPTTPPTTPGCCCPPPTEPTTTEPTTTTRPTKPTAPTTTREPTRTTVPPTT